MLFSGVYELWPDPLIVSCHGADPVRLAFQIPREADVLHHPIWLTTAGTIPRLLRLRLEARRRRKRLHWMSNAVREHALLDRLGFRGALVSTGVYINGQQFTITGEAKRYDAVYAAQMADFKRLWLAAGIPSLYVLTYGDRKTANGEYDLHGFEPRIAHCDFNRGWESPENIARAYNRSRVGLALSRREGAMLASVEYMLCGLPLVSTPSEGGREQFFDARYVEVVNPTAEAVAAGVQRLASAQIDPAFIREQTLHKLVPHRERLADYVIAVIKSRGAAPPTKAAMLDHLFPEGRSLLDRYVHRREFAGRRW